MFNNLTTLLLCISLIIILKHNNNMLLGSTTFVVVDAAAVTTVVNNNNNNLQKDSTTSCPLVTFLPFTDLREGPTTNDNKNENNDEYYGYGQWPSPQVLGKATFSLMATTLMAIDHFNHRDTSVIPELKYYTSCNITIPTPTIIRDSGYSRSKVVDEILLTTTKNLTTTTTNNNQNQQQLSWCAIISPIDPIASEGLSIVAAEHLNIPLVGYATIADNLSKRDEYPTYIRSIPSATKFASSIPKYFQRDIWKRDYIAILYQRGDYGEQFEDAIEDLTTTDSENDENLNFRIITENFVNIKSIRRGLTIIKQEGYHTIFVAGDRQNLLYDIAIEADKLGLIGNDYVWIFTGDMIPLVVTTTTTTTTITNNMQYEVDTPQDKILRGAAIVTNYDPFIYKQSNNDDDDGNFLKAWKRLQHDSTNDDDDDENMFLKRLIDIHPLDPSDDAYWIPNENSGQYFQKEIPTVYASFLYDAIVNTGMSKCRAYEKSTNHIDEYLQSDFVGASGRTVFNNGNNDSSNNNNKGDDDNNSDDVNNNEDGGGGGDGLNNSRDVVGVKFGVYNIRPGPINEDSNTRGCTRHLTAIFDGTEEIWRKVEGEEFIFFDGTTEQPQPVRDTIDYNFLSPSIRIVGFVFVGLSLCISCGSAIWIFVRRKERIVTASQPQFLYLLCFGAALTAISLIFDSFDESYGWTESQLDKACAAIPWFFVLGYLIQYCAIFCKLWRLSKLLEMRRKVVQFHKVLLPFCLIIGSSIVILIVWQVIDPLQWERSLVLSGTDGDGLPGEPWVSYGKCTSVEKGVLPFVVPLSLLFVSIMIMTMIMSWKMKNVQKELSEAKLIFVGIFSHLQVWAVGIPIYLILDGNRDASYLISMAFVVVFSNAFVILIVGPKLVFDLRGGGEPAKSKPRRNKISVTGGVTHVTGISNNNTPSAGPTCASEREKIVALQTEIRNLKADLEAASIYRTCETSNEGDDDDDDDGNNGSDDGNETRYRNASPGIPKSKLSITPDDMRIPPRLTPDGTM